MEFCPQAVVVGNLAEWAAVVVAAAVGYLVWKLTAAANRIATEAHVARVQSELRETLHVGLLVFRELALASSALSNARDLLNTHNADTKYIVDEAFRLQVNTLITGIQRTDAGQNPHVLAKLPGQLGADAVMAWNFIDLALEQIRASRIVTTESTLGQTFRALKVMVPEAMTQCEETAQNARAAISNLAVH